MKHSHRKERQAQVAAVWTWPITLGVLTAIGLVSALFSEDGFGDMLANVCLAIVVIVVVWYGWMRRSPD